MGDPVAGARRQTSSSSSLPGDRAGRPPPPPPPPADWSVVSLPPPPAESWSVPTTPRQESAHSTPTGGRAVSAAPASSQESEEARVAILNAVAETRQEADELLRQRRELRRQLRRLKEDRACAEARLALGRERVGAEAHMLYRWQELALQQLVDTLVRVTPASDEEVAAQQEQEQMLRLGPDEGATGEHDGPGRGLGAAGNRRHSVDHFTVQLLVDRRKRHRGRGDDPGQSDSENEGEENATLGEIMQQGWWRGT